MQLDVFTVACRLPWACVTDAYLALIQLGYYESGLACQAIVLQASTDAVGHTAQFLTWQLMNRIERAFASLRLIRG